MKYFLSKCTGSHEHVIPPLNFMHTVIHCHTDQLKHNSIDPQIPLQPDSDEQWLLLDADSNQPY